MRKVIADEKAVWTVERTLTFASTTALLGVILCYASLLPLGKWHPDEFTRLHSMQTYGWRALADMIFGWAPRPVSELILWAYDLIVTWSGQPHAAYFLAAIWAVTLAGLYFVARREQRHPALIATVLVAAFLLLEKPGEMFYWPVGAAAYLLQVATLGMACLLTAERQPDSWLIGMALVAAAWCSEIGAMTVLLYCAFLLVAQLSWVHRVRLCWPTWGVVVVASLFPIVITALHRRTINEVMLPGSPTVGSLWRSLIAALPDQLHELVTARLGAGWWVIPAALAVKLLLFSSFRAFAADRSVDTNAKVRSVLLGLALTVSGFASIVLSYDKFGIVCCERHETLRATLTVLAIYSFAQAWPTRQSRPWQAGLLALPLLAVFCWRAPDLIYDHSLIGPTLSNRIALWQSGERPGPTMIWTNAPTPRIADGDWRLPLGSYTLMSGAGQGELDWRVRSILEFFGKQNLNVRPRELLDPTRPGPP